MSARPTPQEIVETGLAAAQDIRDCVVIVTCTSIANLRWARTTLTTNGETETVSVAVVAITDVEGGVAAGSVTGQIESIEDVLTLVSKASQAARQAGPADDAGDLLSRRVRRGRGVQNLRQRGRDDAGRARVSGFEPHGLSPLPDGVP